MEQGWVRMRVRVRVRVRIRVRVRVAVRVWARLVRVGTFSASAAISA